MTRWLVVAGDGVVRETRVIAFLSNPFPHFFGFHDPAATSSPAVLFQSRVFRGSRADWKLTCDHGLVIGRGSGLSRKRPARITGPSDGGPTVPGCPNSIAGPMDPEIQRVSLLVLLLMEKKITGQSARPSSSSHVLSHTAVNGAVVGEKDLGDAVGAWTDDDKRRDKAAEPRTDQGRAQSVVMAVATKLLRSLSITSQRSAGRRCAALQGQESRMRL